MFTARCAKPECKNMLVRRRQASPSATSAGTSAPRIKTSRGCCSSPASNGTPALLTPTAATSTYTATQTLMRPNVTGRREIKGRLVDASGAGSHGRGRRLESWWRPLGAPRTCSRGRGRPRAASIFAGDLEGHQLVGHPKHLAFTLGDVYGPLSLDLLLH